jgi:hypothetical protein
MPDDLEEFSDECENNTNKCKKHCFTFSSESDDDKLSSKLFPERKLLQMEISGRKLEKVVFLKVTCI